MTIRLNKLSEAASLDIKKRFRSRFSKIYIFWLLGIVIDAIQLRPQSISLLGATFAIDKPDLVPGFLFLISLGLFLATLAEIKLLGPTRSSKRDEIRDAIYMASFPGYTLKNHNADRIALIKGVAISHIRINCACIMIFFLLPPVHIVAFKGKELTSAFRLLF